MNKKGTTMVEAAMVLPIVIFSVAIVLLMLSFFLQKSSLTAQTHMAALENAGECTGTVLRHDKKIYDLIMGKNHRGVKPCRTATGAVQARIAGPMAQQYHHRKTGSAYEINEKKYIRNVDLVRGNTENVEDSSKEESVP